jgi:hypothetical protein
VRSTSATTNAAQLRCVSPQPACAAAPHAPSTNTSPPAGTWPATLSRAGVGIVQASWHVGRLAVPLSCIALAAVRPDALHGVYVLIALPQALAACLGGTPAPPRPPPPSLSATSVSSPVNATAGGAGVEGAAPPSSLRFSALPVAARPLHVVLRVYAAAHMLVIYVALLLHLPGLTSPASEQLLRLLGLWDPRLLTDLLPVLALLGAATVHAAAGKWLQAHSPVGVCGGAGTGTGAGAGAGGGSGAATTGTGASGSSGSVQGRLDWLAVVQLALLQRWMLWVGRTAASSGAALLVLLVCAACSVCVLCAFVCILAPLKQPPTPYVLLLYPRSNPPIMICAINQSAPPAWNLCRPTCCYSGTLLWACWAVRTPACCHCCFSCHRKCQRQGRRPLCGAYALAGAGCFHQDWVCLRSPT